LFFLNATGRKRSNTLSFVRERTNASRKEYVYSHGGLKRICYSEHYCVFNTYPQSSESD